MNTTTGTTYTNLSESDDLPKAPKTINVKDALEAAQKVAISDLIAENDEMRDVFRKIVVWGKAE